MVDQRPSVEQRDRCLDELATAYAQGRISDSEFAVRSDTILTGDSLRDLDDALAGLRLAQPYPPAAPLCQPQRPPTPLDAPTAKPRGATRRQLFLVGGAAGFVAVAGAGILAAMVTRSLPYSGRPVVEPTPFVRSDFLREDYSGLLERYIAGVMSRVVITKTTIVVLQKPPGQPWQTVTFDVAKGSAAATKSAEPGNNIFDLSEANIMVISEVVERSADTLKDTVASVEFVRPSPAVGVQIVVTAERGGTVVWDALSRQVVAVAPA